MSGRPKVGEVYDVGIGQAPGVVVQVEPDTAAWRRVLIRVCTGCCPMPPPDRPDAPEAEWKLPPDEVWIDRAEWEQEARGLDR